MHFFTEFAWGDHLYEEIQKRGWPLDTVESPGEISSPNERGEGAAIQHRSFHGVWRKKSLTNWPFSESHLPSCWGSLSLLRRRRDGGGSWWFFLLEEYSLVVLENSHVQSSRMSGYDLLLCMMNDSWFLKGAGYDLVSFLFHIFHVQSLAKLHIGLVINPHSSSWIGRN